MLRILTVFVIISLAIIGIVAGDCNQKLFDRAMQLGRNNYAECGDNAISAITFAGNEPGRYGDPRNASYRQFYISGDANIYTARQVTNGSKLGNVSVTVNRKTRLEGGDQITVTEGNMTYFAILQPRAISSESAMFVLREVCRSVAAYSIGGISNWPTFLNGSIKKTLNSYESLPTKARHFSLVAN